MEIVVSQISYRGRVLIVNKVSSSLWLVAAVFPQLIVSMNTEELKGEGKLLLVSNPHLEQFSQLHSEALLMAV